MKNITLNLRKRVNNSYKINFSTDYFSELEQDLLNKKWGNKYVIITDSKVRKLYGDDLIKKLKKARIKAEIFSFPHGEKSKTLNQARILLEKMAKSEFHRDDCVIALGGGVVGDLAGFVASVYMRGIPYIQIPTTLLSMVDSSVGGKTGLDTAAGKNLVGSFYHPKKVYIDPTFLKTLPKKQMQNGIAEVIKYGVISKPSILKILKKKKSLIENFDQRILKKIVMQCIAIKSSIVSRDERENSIRRILNYGHTFGHAIEKLSRFKIQHGEAIAIGMAMINTIAVDKKMFAKKNAVKIKELLKLYNLPTKLSKHIDPQKIISAIKVDKKSKNGKCVFIVPKKIGTVIITENITNREIIKACKKHM